MYSAPPFWANGTRAEKCEMGGGKVVDLFESLNEMFTIRDRELFKDRWTTIPEWSVVHDL